MPYTIEKHKDGKKNCYKVVNAETKEVHAKCATKKNAQAQTRLLYSKGDGLLDTFNPDDKKSPVELISFGQSHLTLPKYFIKRMKDTKAGKRKFKLVVPTTKTRNLSTRSGGAKSIHLMRASVDGIELEPAEAITPVPNLSEFSKADRYKIMDMYDEIEYDKINEVKTEHHLQTKKGSKKKTKTPSPQAEDLSPQAEDLSPQAEEYSPTLEEIPLMTSTQGPNVVRGKTLLDKEEANRRKIASKKESAKRIYNKKKAGESYKPKDLEMKISELRNEKENLGGLAQSEIDRLKGRGLFQTIYKAKKAVKSVFNKGEKFVEAIVNPDSAYPPNVKQIKDDHGNEVITRLILRRNPVSSIITGLMNAVSLGSFYKKLGRQPYDKLFHLALLVVTANGGFLLEKIERVNVSKDISLKKGTEELEINNIPSNLTVRELIENTEKEMGNNFLPYNPMTNNCQVFIMNILKANGLLNSTYEEWVKQNTDALFEKDPFLLSLSNKLIDIGKITNVISQGGNLLSKPINMIDPSVMHYHIPHTSNLIKLQLAGFRAPGELPEPLQAGSGIGRFIKGIGRKVTHGVSSGIDTVSDAVSPVANTVQDAIHVANQIGAMPGQVSSAVGDAVDPENLKNAGHEIANILYRRGLPATAGTLAFIAGNAVGGPALGTVASVGASYGTSRAVNEYQPKGLGMGLYAGHPSGEGLYAGGAIGMISPSPIGMKPRSTVKRVKIPIMDGFDGGRLLVDRPISIRSIAHSINDAPKAVTKSVNILAGAGVKRQGRFPKGSQAAKDHMAKIRGMKKK